ncbi:hypothetical protein, partial [Chryseobacterium sp. CH1]|uniref:hypothetical protein n=1 Tax=Chryseobacterium sp. CH1 TaxID=713551 RepID=UPI0013E90DD5
PGLNIHRLPEEIIRVVANGKHNKANPSIIQEFFSKKLNYDYPWSKYSQITGRDYPSSSEWKTQQG